MKDLEPVQEYITQRKRELRTCRQQAKTNLLAAANEHRRRPTALTRATLIRSLANNEIVLAFTDALETIK